jgi:hypothetical protein
LAFPDREEYLDQLERREVAAILASQDLRVLQEKWVSEAHKALLDHQGPQEKQEALEIMASQELLENLVPLAPWEKGVPLDLRACRVSLDPLAYLECQE